MRIVKEGLCSNYVSNNFWAEARKAGFMPKKGWGNRTEAVLPGYSRYLADRNDTGFLIGAGVFVCSGSPDWQELEIGDVNSGAAFIRGEKLAFNLGKELDI